MSEEEYGKYSPPPEEYVRTIDATRTRKQDMRDLKRLIQKYGDNFKDLMEECFKEIVAEEKIRLEQEKLRTKKIEEEMRIQRLPDTIFPKLFRNRVHDPNGLQTWLNKASNNDIKGLLEMYSKNPNQHRSILGDVNEALATLKSALKNEEQSNQKGTLQKIKEKIGYAT